MLLAIPGIENFFQLAAGNADLLKMRGGTKDIIRVGITARVVVRFVHLGRHDFVLQGGEPFRHFKADAHWFLGKIFHLFVQFLERGLGHVRLRLPHCLGNEAAHPVHLQRPDEAFL